MMAVLWISVERALLSLTLRVMSRCMNFFEAMTLADFNACVHPLLVLTP